MNLSRWYAAYTRPRHEKKIVEYLRERSVENFLPLFTTAHSWRNRVTQSIDTPLFPGYVFVKIERPQHGTVLSVPGVLNFVGALGRPIPIPDHEISAVQAGCLLANVEPHPFLKAGMRVLVCRGPLSGHEGILIKQGHGTRLVLSMDLLMRSMSVEVDVADVRPITAMPFSGPAPSVSFV